MLHTYIQTYRQTGRQAYRPSDEVGCRGAFAPKKVMTGRELQILLLSKLSLYIIYVLKHGMKNL